MAALREILIAFGVTVDDKAIDAAEQKTKGFLGTLKDFGIAVTEAFAVKGLWDFTQAQVELGDELGDAAVLMDLSTESLERWRYAAQFAEISGEELSAMFLKVAKSATSAGNDIHGIGGIIKNDLKIDVSKFKTSEEVFTAIGTKLAGMEAGFKRNAIASQLFGKSGGIKILQLFKDGAAGIDRFNEEFENLGGGMLDFAERAGEVDDAQKRLNFAFGNLKVRIAGVLLPAFEWIVVKATKLSAVFVKLVESTRIVQTALVVLGAIGAAKAGLIIAQWLPVLAPFLAWAAAIGLVIVALEDVYGFFTGKNSLIGKAIDAVFGDGAQDRVRAWGENVWSLVKQLGERVVLIFGDTTASVWTKFQELINYLEGEFATGMRSLFGDIAGDVVSTMLGAIAEVIGAFASAADKIRIIFGGLFEYIADGIFKLVDGAANADAQNNRDLAAGKRPATAEDFDVTKKPWYVRAVGAVTGFSADNAVPVRVPGGSDGGGYGPPLPPPAPIINQEFKVPPGTPAQQQKYIADAAASGTTKALTAPNRAATRSLTRRGKPS